MAPLNYPNLPVAGDGDSTLVEGNTLPATELQSLFDAIRNHVNGGLDQDSFDPSTQIPGSLLALIGGAKVDDHSATAAEAAQTTSPGDSATPSLATSNDGEIERLRHRIGASRLYGGTVQYRNSAGTMQNASWVEPPIQGRNLIANAGFETGTITSGDAPQGWVVTGTLATSALTAAAQPSIGLHKRGFNFTTASATQGGVDHVARGLKASTKYLLGVTYQRSSGAVNVTTLNALSSGDYQTPIYTDAFTTGLQTVNLVFSTDATPSDVTLRISETTTAGSITLYETWLYELSEDAPSELDTILTQTASVSAEDATLPTTFSTAWDSNWTTVSGLSLSQYVPEAGYRLVYETQISWASNTSNPDQQYHYGFRLSVDDGSAAVEDGPYFVTADHRTQSFAGSTGTMVLRHIVDNATPGATYTFNPQVTAYDFAIGIDQRPRLHPLVDPSSAAVPSGDTIQSVSRARLYAERM